jgi:hypothetical protein
VEGGGGNKERTGGGLGGLYRLEVQEMSDVKFVLWNER